MRMRDKIAEFCEQNELELPEETLARIQGGLDPRPEHSILYQLVLEGATRCPGGPLDEEYWSAIRDLVLAPGSPYKPLPVPLPEVRRSAESLLPYMYPKLSQVKNENAGGLSLKDSDIDLDKMRAFIASVLDVI